MLKYINFKKSSKILSATDIKMQEISKYYLKFTKKQINIMTNKLKKNCKNNKYIELNL